LAAAGDPRPWGRGTDSDARECRDRGGTMKSKLSPDISCRGLHEAFLIEFLHEDWGATVNRLGARLRGR